MNKSMADDTKLAQIRNAMLVEDWNLALKIASTFRRLGEHKVEINRAAEAIKNPRLYKQIGFDLDVVVEKGIEALKQRFNKSWESVQEEKLKNCN